MLGHMYENGEGVPQDYPQALRWYRAAADQNNAGAQFNLGVMYQQGWGVPQDDAEAVKWWRKSADQGDPSSQYNLGLMYSYGRGLPQDFIYAHMWLNLAAVHHLARDNAVRSRDAISAKMTRGQIAEAQRLAREWKPKELVRQ